MAGWTYEPLFPYWADQANAFQVLVDDFVSTADGTGIVHMAPAYGEDDFRICSPPPVSNWWTAWTPKANFLPIVSDFAGRNAKEADKDIIRRLKEAGRLVRQSPSSTAYPFCERTDTPLIYRAIEAWYVRVEDLRDDMVANNEAVRWVPAGTSVPTASATGSRCPGLEYLPQPFLGILHPGLGQRSRPGRHDLHRFRR